jgi:hypothetical protein
MPIARNRIKFIETAIHPRQSRPDIPCLENGPFRLDRWVPTQNGTVNLASIATRSHNFQFEPEARSARIDIEIDFWMGESCARQGRFSSS